MKHDKEALAGFQCVGFLTAGKLLPDRLNRKVQRSENTVVVAGLNCQSLYLQYGKGNICVLKRSEILEVPTNISPLSSLIAVLVLVWAMRVCPTADVCLSMFLIFTGGSTEFGRQSGSVLGEYGSAISGGGGPDGAYPGYITNLF